MVMGVAVQLVLKDQGSFLTKEERIELLKEYKNDLEKETQGVAEKIKELEVA
jgi:hypothetical protein